MKIEKGTTRFVILLGKYAFKFPRIHFKAKNRWPLFLRGLLANMTEKQFSSVHDESLCPVVFSMWGGWFNIMLRAEPLSKDEWLNLDFKTIFQIVSSDLVENKITSFGKLNNKIVAVDYDGSYSNQLNSYLIFGGWNCESNGGLKDFEKSFTGYNEALCYLKELMNGNGYDWGHILDCKTLNVYLVNKQLEVSGPKKLSDLH